MGTRPSLDLIFVLLAEGINFVTIQKELTL